MTLKEIRELRKLTQNDFAAKMNTNQSNVSDWEAGRHSPTLRSLILIATVLDCNIKITSAGIEYLS